LTFLIETENGLVAVAWQMAILSLSAPDITHDWNIQRWLSKAAAIKFKLDPAGCDERGIIADTKDAQIRLKWRVYDLSLDLEPELNLDDMTGNSERLHLQIVDWLGRLLVYLLEPASDALWLLERASWPQVRNELRLALANLEGTSFATSFAAINDESQ
jgi:hypothetical protein